MFSGQRWLECANSPKGVDDVLALLLAFAASPEQLKVELVSLTHGNTEIEDCTRNALSVFHVISLEQKWRRENNLPVGFEGLQKHKPTVAVGAGKPLTGIQATASYYHGKDGLGGVHTSNPQFSAPKAWNTLLSDPDHSFNVSKSEAHLEILRVLKENPPNTVTIIAVGPLTNLWQAAASDVETFLKAKEVVVMGGAVDLPGNITPMAEFNFHGDAVAAARVLSLTSWEPLGTQTTLSESSSFLKHIPEGKIDNPLRLTLFPLDVTGKHCISLSDLEHLIASQKRKGSPLAAWVEAFLDTTFKRVKARNAPGVSLHDPLCVWYVMTRSKEWHVKESEDIRIETTGHWTKGACIVDRRGIAKKPVEERSPEDTLSWLVEGQGNQVRRVLDSPPNEAGENHGAMSFGKVMFQTIYGIAL